MKAFVAVGMALVTAIGCGGGSNSPPVPKPGAAPGTTAASRTVPTEAKAEPPPTPAAPVAAATAGDVKGVVTYKGKPLDGGQIGFKGTTGLTISADISKDGTYAVTGVPPGKVQVVVSYIDPKVAEYFKAASAAGRGMGEMPKGDPSQFVKVPQKFGDFGASGLTAEVKVGPNTVDIALKD